MKKTIEQYKSVISTCRSLFEKKMKDYGTSWRILRISSLTDQLYIKAWRIRSIEEKGKQRVEDATDTEFVGIVNYSLIALIQLSLEEEEPVDLPVKKVLALYDKHAQHCMELMLDKNHDYGEVWRDMRITSMTDLILTKLLRIKQIEDNQGKTYISEGLEANFRDIVNYAVFALIKINELEDIKT